MLAEAVDSYVERRRLEGALFVVAEQVLKAFCKHMGNVSLMKLSPDRLSTFVKSTRATSATALSKYSTVKCFLEFWCLRGETKELRLVKPARYASTKSPFIYTQSEVRALLAATSRCQERNNLLSAEAFRYLLITMYATGAKVGEVLELRCGEVNLKRRRISFGNNGTKARRTLPIGSDLVRELVCYISSHSRQKADDEFFRYVSKERIRYGYLSVRFRRLRKIAGISRSGGRTPCLEDLRYSFAVNQITAWVRQKADLNELIPALSTYMGYATLTKAEQFLAYVPDRFHDDLIRLSPYRARKHWRDQPALMSRLLAL